MAKKASKGLSYFNIDTTLFSDLKIRKLIKYQGGKAVTVYAYLLCSIYQDGYYMLWDDELPFMISESTGFDEAYIREVIKCCLTIGLFDKSLFEKESVLTSAGIQKRFEEVCVRSKRKFRVSEFNLINTEDIPISSEVMGISSEVMPINTEFMPQSKVKESKVNESNTPPPKKDLHVSMPKYPEDCFDLKPNEIQNSIEFIFRLKRKNLNAVRINEMWKAFELSSFSGEKYYKSRSDIMHHFMNWLKNQDLEESKIETHRSTAPPLTRA